MAKTRANTVVRVKCRQCGEEVLRMSEMPGQPTGWQSNVTCTRCRGEDYEQTWDRELEGQARGRLLRRIAEFDATAGYEAATLGDPDVRDTRWGRTACEAVAACELDDRARAGLMFFGPTGIGKTFAGFAVCNAVAEKFGADQVRFVSEEALLGGDVAPWELRGRLQAWLRGASVILIDDIGVATRRSDQIQSAWKELCGQIAGHQGPLIIVGTTNRQGWDGDVGLAAWMGAQSTSRLRQWTEDCTTGWVDRRTDTVHERWRDQLTRTPEQ